MNLNDERSFLMANLTSKELTAIEEQCSNEIILVKKYRSYAEQSTDQTLKTKWTQMADKHQQHYFTLMNHLGSVK